MDGFNKWAERLPNVYDLEKIEKIDAAWEELLERHLAKKSAVKNGKKLAVKNQP